MKQAQLWFRLHVIIIKMYCNRNQIWRFSRRKRNACVKIILLEFSCVGFFLLFIYFFRFYLFFVNFFEENNKSWVHLNEISLSSVFNEIKTQPLSAYYMYLVYWLKLHYQHDRITIVWLWLFTIAKFKTFLLFIFIVLR